MEKITPKSHEIDKIPSKAPATDIIDLTLTDDEESHQPTNIKEEPCNYDLLIGISSSPSQMPPQVNFLDQIQAMKRHTVGQQKTIATVMRRTFQRIQIQCLHLLQLQYQRWHQHQS